MRTENFLLYVYYNTRKAQGYLTFYIVNCKYNYYLKMLVRRSLGQLFAIETNSTSVLRRVSALRQVMAVCLLRQVLSQVIWVLL